MVRDGGRAPGVSAPVLVVGSGIAALLVAGVVGLAVHSGSNPSARPAVAASSSTTSSTASSSTTTTSAPSTTTSSSTPSSPSTTTGGSGMTTSGAGTAGTTGTNGLPTTGGTYELVPAGLALAGGLTLRRRIRRS